MDELIFQTREDVDSTGLDTTFVYKVVDGPCEREHYGQSQCTQCATNDANIHTKGLKLAMLASLPESVHAKAKEVSTKLTELETEGE